MKLVEYRINRYGNELCYGVQLNEGNQWLCVKENNVDYILDGFVFINRKYIRDLRDRIANEQGSMVYKIMPLKYTQIDEDRIYFDNVCLDDYREFFHGIMTKNRLVGVGLHKSNSFYVGTICQVNDKCFILDSIDREGNPDDRMRIQFEKVRYVSMDSDYLKSLEIYLKWRNTSR